MDMAGVEDPERASLYYLDSKNSWRVVGVDSGRDSY